MTDAIKPIVFTRHALDRCTQRGTTEADVIRAIRQGTREPANRNLWQCRLNLDFGRHWAGNWYAVQQVAPGIDDEPERIVVVTIFTYYF